jgi:hypothetical protein
MPVRGQIPDTGISLKGKRRYLYPSYTTNMPIRVRYSVSLFNKSWSCRVTKLLTASGEIFDGGEVAQPPRKTSKLGITPTTYTNSQEDGMQVLTSTDNVRKRQRRLLFDYDIPS